MKRRRQRERNVFYLPTLIGGVSGGVLSTLISWETGVLPLSPLSALGASIGIAAALLILIAGLWISLHIRRKA